MRAGPSTSAATTAASTSSTRPAATGHRGTFHLGSAVTAAVTGGPGAPCAPPRRRREGARAARHRRRPPAGPTRYRPTRSPGGRRWPGAWSTLAATTTPSTRSTRAASGCGGQRRTGGQCLPPGPDARGAARSTPWSTPAATTGTSTRSTPRPASVQWTYGLRGRVRAGLAQCRPGPGLRAATSTATCTASDARTGTAILGNRRLPLGGAIRRRAGGPAGTRSDARAQGDATGTRPGGQRAGRPGEWPGEWRGATR